MTPDWKSDPLEDTPPVIGTGSFLADQGYSDPEEASVKFQLANQIALLIEDRGLRQADVCNLTGLPQPDIARIVNGNVANFSVWRLLLVLRDLGQKITISVKAPDDEKARSLAVAL